MCGPVRWVMVTAAAAGLESRPLRQTARLQDPPRRALQVMSNRRRLPGWVGHEQRPPVPLQPPRLRPTEVGVGIGAERGHQRGGPPGAAPSGAGGGEQRRPQARVELFGHRLRLHRHRRSAPRPREPGWRRCGTAPGAISHGAGGGGRALAGAITATHGLRSPVAAAARPRIACRAHQQQVAAGGQVQPRQVRGQCVPAGRRGRRRVPGRRAVRVAVRVRCGIGLARASQATTAALIAETTSVRPRHRPAAPSPGAGPRASGAARSRAAGRARRATARSRPRWWRCPPAAAAAAGRRPARRRPGRGARRHGHGLQRTSRSMSRAIRA